VNFPFEDRRMKKGSCKVKTIVTPFCIIRPQPNLAPSENNEKNKGGRSFKKDILRMFPNIKKEILGQGHFRAKGLIRGTSGKFDWRN